MKKRERVRAWVGSFVVAVLAWGFVPLALVLAFGDAFFTRSADLVLDLALLGLAAGGVDAWSVLGAVAWIMLVLSVTNLIRKGRYRVWWIAAGGSLLTQLAAPLGALLEAGLEWIEGMQGASKLPGSDVPTWWASVPLEFLTRSSIVVLVLGLFTLVWWWVACARREHVDRKADIAAFSVGVFGLGLSIAAKLVGMGA